MSLFLFYLTNLATQYSLGKPDKSCHSRSLQKMLKNSRKISWSKFRSKSKWIWYSLKLQQTFKQICLYDLKPHYDNTFLTPLLQLSTLCLNHWEPQQLTTSQYVHCLISMLTRERCEQRLMAGKYTDIVQYFRSESYKNILKIVLITSFIFSVYDTHTTI